MSNHLWQYDEQMQIQITELSTSDPHNQVTVGRFRYPAHFSARAEGAGLRHEINLHFETDPTTGPWCESLTVRASSSQDPVSSSSIREVQIARVIRLARRLVRIEPVLDAAGDVIGGTGPRLSTTAGHETNAWKLTDDFLSEVAEIYMANERVVRPSGHIGPTQAVADHYNIDPKKASRWVTTARKRMLLPATGRTP